VLLGDGARCQVGSVSVGILASYRTPLIREGRQCQVIDCARRGAVYARIEGAHTSCFRMRSLDLFADALADDPQRSTSGSEAASAYQALRMGTVSSFA
jgi:hypothetical protein